MRQGESKIDMNRAFVHRRTSRQPRFRPHVQCLATPSPIGHRTVWRLIRVQADTDSRGVVSYHEACAESLFTKEAAKVRQEHAVSSQRTRFLLVMTVVLMRVCLWNSFSARLITTSAYTVTESLHGALLTVTGCLYTNCYSCVV